MTNITDMNYAFNLGIEGAKQKLYADLRDAERKLASHRSLPKPRDVSLPNWRRVGQHLEGAIDYIAVAIVNLEALKKEIR